MSHPLPAPEPASDFGTALLRRFRPPVWAMFYLEAVGALAALVGFTFYLPFHYRAETHPVLMTLVTIVISAVLTMPVIAILALILPFAFRVSLRPSGIRGQNFWGIPTEVRWQNMQNATIFKLAGLRYAAIRHTKSSWRLFVPLFLRRHSEFASTVAQWAPPGNPLLLLLESHGTTVGDQTPSPSLQATPPGQSPGWRA